MRADRRSTWTSRSAARLDRHGLSELLDWARSRISEGVSVDELATEGAMSTRTLNRRFQGALGLPPGEWLQRERLRLAQRLLERPTRR